MALAGLTRQHFHHAVGGHRVKVEWAPCGKGRAMSNTGERRLRLPPRWLIRLAWSVHRGLYRVTGGRVGLWRPRGKRWGTLRLTTTGRRTGRKQIGRAHV